MSKSREELQLNCDHTLNQHHPPWHTHTRKHAYQTVRELQRCCRGTAVAARKIEVVLQCRETYTSNTSMCQDTSYIARTHQTKPLISAGNLQMRTEIASSCQSQLARCSGEVHQGSVVLLVSLTGTWCKQPLNFILHKDALLGLRWRAILGN